MFTPNQIDVRRFFCGAYRKMNDSSPMEAIEALAAAWIREHPEYHATLADEPAAIAAIGTAAPEGQENPFLHLSMHLSISEQCSIDQPPGVRAAIEALTAKLDSLHNAHHVAMDELGRMIWESQQKGIPPDATHYVEQLSRKASA